MSLSKIPEGSVAPEFAVRPAPAVAGGRELLQAVVDLFKLRVVSLLLLAAVGGAFLGAHGWPGLDNLVLVLLTGGMAAAGASALNQYLERGSDGRMGRTRLRPLVTGRFEPRTVLWIAILLILLPSLAVLPFRPALSFFLLLGAAIYVGIYTVWLKPRTALNIVIGGAAGSAAVMSGGAAVGQWADPAVIVLALLIFLWTPSHFWSLAILYRNEYRDNFTPMLPAGISPRRAAAWILVHTLPTGLAAILLAVAPALHWLYLVAAVTATLYLLARNFQLITTPTAFNARRFFVATNFYLMVLLVAICIDATFFGA